MTPVHILGLIVPPAAGLVPCDGPALYSGRPVRFIARGLGLPVVSAQGFDSVVDRVLRLALELREAGAQAISVMGTSLSFYRGVAFADELRDRMREATGVPCTTMSHAIVASLRRLSIKRVAIATGYTDELNERLVSYLAAFDIAVTRIEGLSITNVDALSQVPASTLFALAERVVAAGGAPQGLLFSNGGLLTLDLHVPLEAHLGLPVTSSSPAGFWDLMTVAGLEASSPRHGRLFEPEARLERAS